MNSSSFTENHLRFGGTPGEGEWQKAGLVLKLGLCDSEAHALCACDWGMNLSFPDTCCCCCSGSNGLWLFCTLFFIEVEFSYRGLFLCQSIPLARWKVIALEKIIRAEKKNGYIWTLKYLTRPDVRIGTENRGGLWTRGKLWHSHPGDI